MIERHGVPMKNSKKWISSEQELPFVLLLIVGIMELLYISLESLFSYIGYYLVEDYIIVPCLLFAGIALTRQLTPLAKRRMLLGAIAVTWFAVVQVIHKLSGMGTHPIGTVFFVYLMAFPFASVTEDRESRGLTLISGILFTAAMIQVFYTALLLLDCVPALMKPYVYWDGARLHVFWHSNITACLLLVGIGTAFSFMFRTREWKWKVLLGVSVVLQFVAMALTNCRTMLLMTGALVGSVGFFMIYKGGWKRFVIGILALLVVMAVCFKGSSKIYELHNTALRMQITQQLQQEKQEDPLSAQEETKEELDLNYSVDAESGEVELISQNGQGTLSNDMRTLNGRTGIWKAALQAIRDNRTLALWGTEYVGVSVSAYNKFDVVHTHNSWMEALLRLGIPGLLLSLLFTCIAVCSAWVLVWNHSVEIWKKIIAVMTMCVLVAGFLEPYLFITNVYYHMIDFIFFYCTGYLDLWRQQLSKNE